MTVRSFITRIGDTQENEILCSDCLDQMAQYVDLELDGLPADQWLPQLRQHLKQCSVCHEEYHLLRDLSLLERAGETPSIEVLKAKLLKTTRP